MLLNGELLYKTISTVPLSDSMTWVHFFLIKLYLWSFRLTSSVAANSHFSNNNCPISNQSCLLSSLSISIWDTHQEIAPAQKMAVSNLFLRCLDMKQAHLVWASLDLSPPFLLSRWKPSATSSSYFLCCSCNDIHICLFFAIFFLIYF